MASNTANLPRVSGTPTTVTFDGLPSIPTSNSATSGPSPISTDRVAAVELNGIREDARNPFDTPIRENTTSTFMGSPIVPPTNKYRTLVLCFDGTGDQFDADNSNIVEFFSMLAKGDPDRQMVYYQAGIGTYTSSKTATPFFAGISKALDEAIAWNLKSHIMDGYEFLMQNYRANDRICIFGFSRGAYTARCLAGMIHKVGLLPACNHQQVPFAYKMYKREDAFGWKQSNAFKKTFSIDVDIQFLGVWDTVNSVGLIPRRLPFSTSNNIVRTFRHAIALDERRAKFKANMWRRPAHHEAQLSITDQKIAKQLKKAKKRAEKAEQGSEGGEGEAGKPEAAGAGAKKKNGFAKALGVGGKKKTHDNCAHVLENRYSNIRGTPTDVEEVWFAGCHCDVGGGSVSNETKPNLARIPLRWMVRECFRTESGILFQVEGLREIGMDPASLYPVVLPRPPPLSPKSHALQIQRRNKPPPPNMTHDDDASDASSDIANRMTEEEHELYDALSPKYDQLKLKKTWWIFEILPMHHQYQRSNDSLMTHFGWNLAKGRVVPRQKKVGAKVHRSVKIRMETEYEDGKKYVPKAHLELDRVIWVD